MEYVIVSFYRECLLLQKNMPELVVSTGRHPHHHNLLSVFCPQLFWSAGISIPMWGSHHYSE